MILKIKRSLQNICLQIARKQMDFLMGMVVRARPDWSPRQWSNRELLKLSGFFTGDIINVGAWRDEDKGKPSRGGLSKARAALWGGKPSLKEAG